MDWLGNGDGKPEVAKRLVKGNTGQHRKGEAQEGGAETYVMPKSIIWKRSRLFFLCIWRQWSILYDITLACGHL